jgi:hypothetical protein
MSARRCLEKSARGVEARCASSSRRPAALTDAEQDSKELKSREAALLFERIIESVQLPFRSSATDGATRSSRTR